MDLKKIDLDKLQDYAFTLDELAAESMVSNQKFINIKCLDNESLIPTVKAIPIPDNATNGDMIKAMFSNCKDWKAKLEDNDGEVYEVHFVQLPNSLTVNKYEESWWNAPYKEVEE